MFEHKNINNITWRSPDGKHLNFPFEKAVFSDMCVCVCVRERERERVSLMCGEHGIKGDGIEVMYVVCSPVIRAMKRAKKDRERKEG
jgi:hypothetical protein